MALFSCLVCLVLRSTTSQHSPSLYGWILDRLPFIKRLWVHMLRECNCELLLIHANELHTPEQQNVWPDLTYFSWPRQRALPRFSSPLL